MRQIVQVDNPHGGIPLVEDLADMSINAKSLSLS